MRSLHLPKGQGSCACGVDRLSTSHNPAPAGLLHAAERRQQDGGGHGCAGAQGELRTCAVLGHFCLVAVLVPLIFWCSPSTLLPGGTPCTALSLVTTLLLLLQCRLQVGELVGGSQREDRLDVLTRRITGARCLATCLHLFTGCLNQAVRACILWAPLHACAHMRCRSFTPSPRTRHPSPLLCRPALQPFLPPAVAPELTCCCSYSPAESGMPLEAYAGYLDLRKYGTVPHAGAPPLLLPCCCCCCCCCSRDGLCCRCCRRCCCRI